MKLEQMFPRRYASGADLNGPVTLTIARVQPEKMHSGFGQDESSKYVIYFQEAKKGVVMSRTLAHQIAQAVGSEDTDEWGGRKVTIYPEPVNVAGVPRVAIRARAAQLAGNNGKKSESKGLQETQNEN
ncbi:MAG TPA: hypothetical protein VJL34_14545 [Anaerolineales bacterium]|nr:hypothetical protein [Anaerolineales bacterium]